MASAFSSKSGVINQTGENGEKKKNMYLVFYFIYLKKG